MPSLPDPTPQDIESLRRKADDFARKAFADTLKRAVPLTDPTPQPNDTVPDGTASS